MLNKIGIDVVNIDRMSNLNEHALSRMFHPLEIEKAQKIKNDKVRYEFLAGRFASKEALSKALGVGFTKLSLSEILVTNLKSGQPVMILEGKSKENFPNLNIEVSISHDYPCAVAVVLIEVNNGKS